MRVGSHEYKIHAKRIYHPKYDHAYHLPRMQKVSPPVEQYLDVSNIRAPTIDIVSLSVHNPFSSGTKVTLLHAMPVKI